MPNESPRERLATTQRGIRLNSSLKVVSYAYWILEYRADAIRGILVYEIYDWR